MSTEDPWSALRRFTAARIGLGRAGVSIPTSAHLAFQLAHAQARDAVHAAFDADGLGEALRAAAVMAWPQAKVLVIDSAAPDRATYLRRPDLGRRLSDGARAALALERAAHADEGGDRSLDGGAHPGPGHARAGALPPDLAIVVADGLSARAVQAHAAPLVGVLVDRLAGAGWKLAPLVVVRQGRVAVGDEIGEALGARAVLVLLGERPGLSSPDSLGAYLSWAPRAGLTDAQRNCVSNIRPEGLPIDAAAGRLLWLLQAARARGLTGVELKDESDAALPGPNAAPAAIEARAVPR